MFKKPNPKQRERLARKAYQRLPGQRSDFWW
jgi:hypothetical protein